MRRDKKTRGDLLRFVVLTGRLLRPMLALATYAPDAWELWSEVSVATTSQA